MNKNAPLSLDKLYFAGKFGQTLVYFVSHFVGLDWFFGAIWIHISRNWYLIQKDLNDGEKIKREVWSSEIAKFKFRKGVGSGDAVERSCGWEEEMREELRKDWWGGKIFRIFVCICMFSCICICIWAVQGLVQRRTNIQLLICIQTQVGGLGKWVAGHLWLLHTSNHGKDVRLLLRSHCNHISSKDLKMDTNTDFEMLSSSVLCGCFERWKDEMVSLINFFRQMQQRGDDGFDKTSACNTCACPD